MLNMQMIEWLTLNTAPQLGRAFVHQLDWSCAPSSSLIDWICAQCPTLPAATLHYLKHPAPAQFNHISNWLSPHNHLITWACDHYPPLLRELSSPPLILYASGDLACLNKPTISVVGARRSTAAGRLLASQFANDWATLGQVVVSGMAAGIDAAAHRGAMKGGQTIAVLGTGIDQIYPRAHTKLAHDIRHQGLLISPFALGAPPRRQHFPARNQIISGLSPTTVVIEANEKSGSLITARAALAQGRDVWAVPWSLGHPMGQGCLSLLSDGAGLLRESGDLFLTTPPPVARASLPPALTQDKDCQRIWPLLTYEAMSINQLCVDSGLPVNRCTAALARLECAQLITINWSGAAKRPLPTK